MVPALVLDHRRAVQRNKYDCCCCCGPTEKHLYTEPTGYCGNKVPGCAGGTPLLPRLIESWVRLLLKNNFTRFFVVGVWAGILGAAIAGLAQLKPNFQLEWFFPSDSYVTDYFAWSDKYFSQGVRVSIYLRGHEGKTEAQVYKCIDDVNSFISAGGSGYLSTVGLTNKPTWVTTFKSSTSPAADGSDFYSKLNTYTTSDTAGQLLVGRSLRWKTAGTASDGLSAIKIGPVTMVESTHDDDGQERFDSMEALRGAVNGACPFAFPYARDFLYWEETGYIGPEFARNAAIACSVILIIVFALIPRISVNIPCIITIFSTILEVLGFLHWYGEYVNGVVSIYTVICIGLSVDYVAHIGHVFKLSNAPNGAAKTLDAMTRIGPSVFNALFSTLLAVSLLAPSGSFVFSVFFKVLFLVVIFGFVNALMVTPVLLCLFNGGGDLPPRRTDGGVGIESPTAKLSLTNGNAGNPGFQQQQQPSQMEMAQKQ